MINCQLRGINHKFFKNSDKEKRSSVCSGQDGRYLSWVLASWVLANTGQVLQWKETLDRITIDIGFM